MKEKLFGFKGTITPTAVVKDLSENWEQDEISFAIKDGIFEAKYSDKSEKEKALATANLYIQSWNLEHNSKLTIDFNHFWEPKENGGTAHGLTLGENIKVSERVMINTITHSLSFSVKAKIVGKSDSASFSANQALVEKATKDATLQEAIRFYSDEVVDEKRPLYGVYKALEVLIGKLRVGAKEEYGMEVLGRLAGKNKNYVKAVKETTQLQRHAKTSARKLLSEQECRDRVRILIKAYANSVPA